LISFPRPCIVLHADKPKTAIKPSTAASVLILTPFLK
jgi:hypothetical protein